MQLYGHVSFDKLKQFHTFCVSLMKAQGMFIEHD